MTALGARVPGRPSAGAPECRGARVPGRPSAGAPEYPAPTVRLRVLMPAPGTAAACR